MTFIIVCLVLSGCGAGTQEAALGPGGKNGTCGTGQLYGEF